jgi:hypothetical protein
MHFETKLLNFLYCIRTNFASSFAKVDVVADFLTGVVADKGLVGHRAM